MNQPLFLIRDSGSISTNPSRVMASHRIGQDGRKFIAWVRNKPFFRYVFTKV